MYVRMYMYIYIYIYEREREKRPAAMSSVVLKVKETY
jgi:hypothetical protein